MKIILLGAPGSGKGTVSNFLCKKYNLMHISTGDLFRAALKKDDDFANKIKSYVTSGAYVPDEITNKIAMDAIAECKQAYAGFILDGYPRTINQADFLKTQENIDCVILLNVDEDTLIKRISGRRVCPKCNTIYNIYFYNKPQHDNICDNCQTELVQRNDDNVEIATSRIKLFLNQTKPLVQYYKEQQILFDLDATIGVDELISQIDNILSKFN